MYYQYFSDNVIALLTEIRKHPDLMTILAVQQNPDPHIHLAEIAAYCGILLDATYTPEDIDKLCGIMVNKLQEKRVIVIHSTSSH